MKPFSPLPEVWLILKVLFSMIKMTLKNERIGEVRQGVFKLKQRPLRSVLSHTKNTGQRETERGLLFESQCHHTGALWLLEPQRAFHFSLRQNVSM